MATDSIQLTGTAPAGVVFIYYDASEQPYSTATSAHEAWQDGHYANYRVTATQQGTSNKWAVTRPTDVALVCSFVARLAAAGVLANETPLGQGGVGAADLRAIKGVAAETVTRVPVDLADLAGALGVAVYAPATGSTLDLIRGDSYQNADGRGITVTKQSNETHWPTTLSTVDFSCKPTEQTLATYASAASLSQVSCTVTQATGDDQAYRIDLTAAQLVTLQAAVRTTANGYTYWVVANRATNVATLRTGVLNVRPDYSAT